MPSKEREGIENKLPLDGGPLSVWWSARASAYNRAAGAGARNPL